MFKDKYSLTVWLNYIENLHNNKIDLGLDRVRLIANRLELLNPNFFVFTVTGTNGKGTTCRMIESFLVKSGYKVGVYSSPHLINYTERIRINEKEINEDNHISSFIAIEKIRSNITLSFFEYSTISALWLFKKANLDIVILEVGLGGRLDATNIIDSNVAIITNIAIDHTYFLGTNREDIGREKAGIFRTNSLAVIGDFDIPKSIISIASKINTQLFCYGKQWIIDIKDNYWNFISNELSLINLPIPYIPTINAAIALVAVLISKLKIKENLIRCCLSETTLPGRFQIVNLSPLTILDVAHNPHAATYLVSRISKLKYNGKVHIIIGILNDKDILGILKILAKIAEFWYCVSTPGPRGTDAKYLVKYLKHAKSFNSVYSALETAKSKAFKKDVIVICGSFYIVSEVIKII